MSSNVDPLPGHETLVACWRALAQSSAGARVAPTPSTIAAVFPSWAPLNNAILLGPPEQVAVAASELAGLYADAGVDAWALWVPSRVKSLDAADAVRAVDGLERDTTTLVMRATLTNALRRHDHVVPASVAAVARLDEEPIPVSELGPSETVAGLNALAMVENGVAVSAG